MEKLDGHISPMVDLFNNTGLEVSLKGMQGTPKQVSDTNLDSILQAVTRFKKIYSIYRAILNPILEEQLYAKAYGLGLIHSDHPSRAAIEKASLAFQNLTDSLLNRILRIRKELGLDKEVRPLSTLQADQEQKFAYDSVSEFLELVRSNQDNLKKLLISYLITKIDLTSESLKPDSKKRPKLTNIKSELEGIIEGNEIPGSTKLFDQLTQEEFLKLFDQYSQDIKEASTSRGLLGRLPNLKIQKDYRALN